MAKVTGPTVSGPGGGSVPVPSYWGFKWGKVEKYVSELDRLWQKARDNSKDVMGLREELRYQEQRLAKQRAVAERLDKGPVDETYLDATKKALERAERRDADLRRAARGCAERHVGEIRLHGEEWTREVLDRRNEHDRRLEALAREYQNLVSQRAGLNGLVEWSSGEKQPDHYSPVENIRTGNAPPKDPVISTRNAGAIL